MMLQTQETETVHHKIDFHYIVAGNRNNQEIYLVRCFDPSQAAEKINRWATERGLDDIEIEQPTKPEWEEIQAHFLPDFDYDRDLVKL